LLGWAYCGALIGIGRQLLSLHTTLLIHAVGAPVGFALISRYYYRRFAYTTPVQTAVAFLGVVIALDVFLVAPVFEKNYAMFSSVLGTWIPFGLIFAATYLTGRFTAGGAPTQAGPRQADGR
jgi:peptidoglycan biosynthesis protein MviN/MurJ (putative lipid II flippase)